MLIEVSNATYILLSALVKDALEVRSDATPLLKRAAHELADAHESEHFPEELSHHSEKLMTLRHHGD